MYNRVYLYSGGINVKTVVIYKSKTSFTRKYAKWIQEAIQCDILDCHNISRSSLLEYDVIIYGSRIHAGKIDGLKKIKALLLDNKNIKLVVFATGGTPIEAEEIINSIWEVSFTEDERHVIPHFYMPAGLNYENMGLGDKLIMKALAKMLENKNDKDLVETGCEQAIGHSYDISSREYITPLLEFLNTLA